MFTAFSLTAAELSTERLLLRSWPEADIAAVTEERRLAGWAEDFPADGDRVIAGLFAENPDWLGTYGQRQIVERGSGLVVGSAGLFWPAVHGAVEIGYGVVPSRRGLGYATEATRALAEFARTAADVRTVFANVEPANPASVRVLERAGFLLCQDDGELARYRFG